MKIRKKEKNINCDKILKTQNVTKLNWNSDRTQKLIERKLRNSSCDYSKPLRVTKLKNSNYDKTKNKKNGEKKPDCMKSQFQRDTGDGSAVDWPI